MSGVAASAAPHRPGSGENTSSKTGALTETPTGPRSKKVDGYLIHTCIIYFVYDS